MDFVTKSSVKAYIKQKKMRVASTTSEALNNKVEEMLKAACGRAAKNGRSTVMPQDL